jgi:hypothetical protein
MPYQANADYRTAKGNVAPDLHWVNEVDHAYEARAQLKSMVETDFKPARVVRDATMTYNCHAFVHANRHAWFQDIGPFLRDDYYQYTPGTLLVGDAVVYVKDNQITHSGFITQLIGNQIIELRSKWGAWPEVLHAPTNVPPIYGSIVYYLRRRGTILMAGEIEPDTSVITQKVEDLLFSLLSSERLQELLLASTPEVAQMIVSQFPEIPELTLQGNIAGKLLTEKLATANELESVPLLHAIKTLRYKDALPVIAAKVAQLKEDEGFGTAEAVLLSAFNALRETEVADARKTSIRAAQQFTR